MADIKKQFGYWLRNVKSTGTLAELLTWLQAVHHQCEFSKEGAEFDDYHEMCGGDESLPANVKDKCEYHFEQVAEDIETVQEAIEKYGPDKLVSTLA